MTRPVDNLAILEAAGSIYSMFNFRHYIFFFCWSLRFSDHEKWSCI